MKAILQYLQARGFGCASDAAYERIDFWQAWYRGKVPAFHTYRQYNGKRKLTRQPAQPRHGEGGCGGLGESGAQ